MHLVLGCNSNIFFNEFFLTGQVTSYLDRVGLTRKKLGSIMGQLVFASGKKKWGSG